MKRSVIFVAVCIFACILNMSALSAQTIDKIVAVVNDEPITQSELDQLLIPIYEQYKSAYKGDEFMAKMAEARTNLLTQLIEDSLVAQEAVRLGVMVTEEEVDAQMTEVKSKFPSDDEFKNFLDSQHISYTKLRERYKEQISVRKLHQYEVRQKVVVSPKDIEDYYTQNMQTFTEKEKIKVKTIMIRKDAKGADGSDVIAREKIDMVLKEIKDSVSFSEAAKKYSHETHAASGGDLGFIQRGEMIKAFDEVLFGLSVGAISPVLETEIGYHVFFIEAKQAEKVRPLEEVKFEIEDTLFRIKSKERFTNWMKDLKDNAYISIK